MWNPISGLGEAGGGSRRGRSSGKCRAGRRREEQVLVNFSQAFEDGGIGGDVLAHPDEGADDEEAHLNCLGAVQHRGGHQRAMLGKGEGQVFR